MKKQLKISQVLTGTVMAVFLLAGCQQEEEPSTLDDLYDQGLSLEEIASRLDAKKLEMPELVGTKQEDAGILAKKAEIIRFDNNSICVVQNFMRMPGCTTGYFYDPEHAYYYTLYKTYFFVTPSLGPYKGLAERGAQFYIIKNLSDPDYNHMLESRGNYWTKYDMGTSNKTTYFDLQLIKLVRGKGITLWFLKDGSWWYWPNLGVNNWNLSAYCKGITEFQIRSSSGSQNDEYVIDDIVVNNIIER